MSTSANTITTYFALLALVCNCFVVAVAIAWCLRRRVPELWSWVTASLGPSALTLGAVIAVVATAGSLYLSEGAHFIPCRLCWYQRIGMYPLAVILPIAAIRRDRRVWPYPLALALCALPISIYHVLLEHFPSLETGACDVNNPCSIVWVRHFGFVTIPYMAASGFAAIAVLMAIAALRPTKEITHVNSSTSHEVASPELAPQLDLHLGDRGPGRGRGPRSHARAANSSTAAGVQVRSVTTTGSALPAFDSSTTDPTVGMTIPTVSGASFDGTPVSITNDGKAKVVLFVAHWCPHCQREVPLLADELHRKPLPANVEMITVSTGVDSSAPNYPPSKWLAGVNWPTPVIADDSQSSTASAYGLTAYPYLVFVDAQNHVQFRSSGEMPITEFNQHVAALAK